MAYRTSTIYISEDKVEKKDRKEGRKEGRKIEKRQEKEEFVLGIYQNPQIQVFRKYNFYFYLYIIST